MRIHVHDVCVHQLAGGGGGGLVEGRQRGGGSGGYHYQRRCCLIPSTLSDTLSFVHITSHSQMYALALVTRSSHPKLIQKWQ